MPSYKRIMKGRPSECSLEIVETKLPLRRNTLMTSDKYVGLDVHKATIVGAVHDASGKCLISSIIETKADTIRAFIKGLTGTVHVTLEEGTHAAWLFELIK